MKRILLSLNQYSIPIILIIGILIGISPATNALTADLSEITIRDLYAACIMGGMESKLSRDFDLSNDEIITAFTLADRAMYFRKKTLEKH